MQIKLQFFMRLMNQRTSEIHYNLLIKITEVEDISSIQVFTELEWGRDAFKIIASPRSA